MKKNEEMVEQRNPSIRKGPMEGMIILDGRPTMERCDMPTISFTEADIKRLVNYYKNK